MTQTVSFYRWISIAFISVALAAAASVSRNARAEDPAHAQPGAVNPAPILPAPSQSPATPKATPTSAPAEQAEPEASPSPEATKKAKKKKDKKAKKSKKAKPSPTPTPNEESAADKTANTSDKPSAEPSASPSPVKTKAKSDKKAKDKKSKKDKEKKKQKKKKSEEPAPEASATPEEAAPQAKESSKGAAPPKAKASSKKEATAEKSKVNSNLPMLLQEVEKKYAEAKTLSADFTQVNESQALEQKKTSTGVINVKRPDKVRWETLKPDQNLLVSDGRTFWYYTPPFDPSEGGQLIEKKSSQVQSRLAHALLSGSFSVAKDMKISQQGDHEFVLTPTRKRAAGTVRKAIINIDPEKKLITKVILEHEGGNRSEITLSKIELGNELDDRLFVFIAPPGTERITE